MRPLVPALLLGLALLLPTAVGAQSASVAAVGAGDPDLGKGLALLSATFGYVDANGNGRPDAASPSETLYLDVDGQRGVTYGDLRLTSFTPHLAGTYVDASNGDLGLDLSALPGWFASTQAGAWFADLDNTLTVTAGDVRLTGGLARIGAGDADLQAQLRPAAGSPGSLARLGAVDADGDGRHTGGERLVLDVGGDGKVGAGDLGLRASGPGRDDGPSRLEFEDALRQAGVESGEDGFETVEGTGGGSGGLRAVDVLLLGLGLVNLAGLVLLWRRGPGRPRNPFP
jgi:hypothetical protein